MSQLSLMIVLGLVSSYYFPDSRQAVLDVAAPVLEPAVRWHTRGEMAQVVGDVIVHENRTGELPEGGGWLPWLDHRYMYDDLWTDPWDSVYRLRVWRDSIAIVSNGLDRTQDTEDDFQVVAQREYIPAP